MNSYQLETFLYPFNVSGPCIYVLLMSPGLVILPCIVSHFRRNVKHPSVTKSPQSPRINPPGPHKYPQTIDIHAQSSYSSFITHRSALMSVAYTQAQKQRYRITLDLSVFGDFDPHQIDWEKLFKLEPAEKCDAYVEDLSTPDRW